MRHGKWAMTALAAVFLLPFQIAAAENRCICEENGGTCQCDRTIEQVAEEWANRCRCNVPDNLDYDWKSDTGGSAETDTSEDGAETAKKDEESRFFEIYRDDSFIYYMDRKTARFLNMPHVAKEKLIDVWIKLEPVEYAEGDYTYPAKYFLEHYLIRPKKQQVQFLAELEVTGRPNNEIENRRYDGRKWENLIPGSIEDLVYHAVLKNKGKIRDDSSSDGTSIRDYLEDTLNISL